MSNIITEGNPLFIDLCNYKNRQGLPGSETLPDHWNVVSGEFTTFYENHLRVNDPGEIAYAGDEFVTADIAVDCKFHPIEDTIIEVRGRRSSDGLSYISLEINMENNTITLYEVSGGTTVLQTVNHTFDYDGVFAYRMSIAMNGTQIEGYVNRGLFVEGTSSINTSETGFSIYVPQVWENDPLKISKVSVYQTAVWPDPQLEDQDWDLMLQHRKRLKTLCENPPERTFEYFSAARNAWDHHLNDGKKNIEWSNLGYPIREPVAEEWFD